MARGYSSTALKRFSEVTGIPYVTIERTTRPLLAASPPRWISREEPHLTPFHMASLIVSFAATLPSDSIQAAAASDGLMLQNGEIDEKADPDILAGIRRLPLTQWIENCLVLLMTLDPLLREGVRKRMAAAKFRLVIYGNVEAAVVRWNLNQAEPELKTGEVRLNWARSNGPENVGVERLVSINFDVLSVAAEICLDAQTRSGGVLQTPKQAVNKAVSILMRS